MGGGTLSCGHDKDTVCVCVCTVDLCILCNTRVYWTFISKCLVQHFSTASGPSIRGIMGASTWFTPLSVALLMGQTADPRVVKGLRWLNFHKQTGHTALNTDSHSCKYTFKHVNKQYKTHTYTKRGIFVPAQIDFTQHALYLHCGMLGDTMAFGTIHNDMYLWVLTDPNGPLFTSLPLLFFCLISQTKQCCRSANWAWTIAHKGVTDLVFPALLPTVPRSGQWGVKVNWHHKQAYTEVQLHLETIIAWDFTIGVNRGLVT